MIRLVLALLVLFAAPLSQAQGIVHNSVDEMPELIGGLAALQQHIQYPEAAREDGIEGRVMVQFIVDEEGRVIDPSILQGDEPLLNDAAIAAVQRVEFTPGRHEGQLAKVRMILPIVFVLPQETAAEEDVAAHVDEMPAIVGGMAAFMDMLVYPLDAEERGIEGHVVVSFVVNEQGDVEEAEIVRAAHPLLEGAGLDAIRKTRFTPGIKDGLPVRVRMALPVTFELHDQD